MILPSPRAHTGEKARNFSTSHGLYIGEVVRIFPNPRSHIGGHLGIFPNPTAYIQVKTVKDDSDLALLSPGHGLSKRIAIDREDVFHVNVLHLLLLFSFNITLKTIQIFSTDYIFRSRWTEAVTWKGCFGTICSYFCIEKSVVCFQSCHLPNRHRESIIVFNYLQKSSSISVNITKSCKSNSISKCSA